MKKYYRKIVYPILALGAIVLVATISINSVLKQKLELFIHNRLPENMLRSYDAIHVQTFDGSIVLDNASLSIKNRQDSNKHTFINVEKLKISDISYWDYFVNNEIHIESIVLENPIMAYYIDRMKPTKDTSKRALVNIYKPIIVDRVQLKNTRFVIYEKGKDSTKLYTDGLFIDVEKITVNSETVTRKIPFNYESFAAHSDSVFVKINPFENLTVGNFSIKNQDAHFEDLTLKTKYSKRELSSVISHERDHYLLRLKELFIKNFDFGFKHNRFFAKSEEIALINPSLEIYRDKLVADDPKIKPLYSKMIRNLPFELTVDTIKIADAKIKYEERVNPKNRGGAITFEHLNATISNISNTYTNPKKTQIKAKAEFMHLTPFSVNWSFDVQNKNDQFIFKAQVGPLAAQRMNKFTEPNLKVRLEGQTHKTYFTIDGNNETSITNLKINYSDFKVTILQKNGKKKNRVLSAIANIFISKNSDKKTNNYREATTKATRDKTKSVFNFLWISVKNGLIESMTGRETNK